MIPDSSPPIVDLDKLQELLDAATPRPWRHNRGGQHIIVVDLPEPDDEGNRTDVVAEAWNVADAALVVEAVNALPELLAEIRQLRADRDAGWVHVEPAPDGEVNCPSCGLDLKENQS